MVDKQFGRLTITAIAYIKKYSNQTKPYWVCKCSCGNQVIVRSDHLRQGKIKSCGCLAREIHKKRMKRLATTHGLSRTPEYSSYISMVFRITKPDKMHKKYYTDIKICRRWRGKNGFMNFLNDLGKRPSLNYSLDRINPFGNYEPNNCRWATRSQQMLNTRRNTTNV